uniref:Nuclear receptor domain-containing protein n=1 Tax=Meloidogyne incognita TaxID=6306 RepID=A0A914N0B0_MELIC
MNKEINNSRKKLLFCAVCGKQCESRNYCVISCASCKQFFRRTVVQQKATTCRRLKKCDIINGEKCRGCRLDKCLIEGMDPLMVKTTDVKCRKEFIEMIEKRRNKLHQTVNNLTSIHQQDEENLNNGNENLNYNEDNDETIICAPNKYRKSTTSQIKNKLDYNEKIITKIIEQGDKHHNMVLKNSERLLLRMERPAQ